MTAGRACAWRGAARLYNGAGRNPWRTSDVWWYGGVDGKQVAVPAWVEFLLSGICHRFPGHALTYGGQLSPLCARCTGMYCGALLVLVLLAAAASGAARDTRPGIVQGMVLALAVWWALDGANAFAYELLGRPWLYEPADAIRLLTGLGMGMGIAIELWPVAVQTIVDAPDPTTRDRAASAECWVACRRGLNRAVASERQASLGTGRGVEHGGCGDSAGGREHLAAGSGHAHHRVETAGHAPRAC